LKTRKTPKNLCVSAALREPKEPAVKPALVPKLRFPEFREAAGWTEKPLKAAAHINPANGWLPESFVYIDLESVDAGELKAKQRISRIGAPSRAQRLVERGDIIYQVVRPYQRNNLLCEFDDDEDYVASTGYAQLRAKGSNRFLYQSIHTDSFVGRVIAKCTGSNYPAINSSDLAEIQLPIPPTLPEQQKIAECLSSVDELIAAHARKLDALKTHKKGLMQQLFPREGETQPRLRFPEFRDAGEWSEGQLSDIATVLQGYGFPERYQGQKGGDYPFYKVSDISRSLAAGKVFIEESANYINESLLKELRARPIPEGSTVFAKIGEAIRSNKRAITTVPCLIDNNAAGVKRIKGKATDFFIYLVMEQISLIEHAGGVVPSVNKSALESIPVKFPEIAEQHRIADCLTSLDDLIAAQTQKLGALKTHKQALMQQLFPSSEETA